MKLAGSEQYTFDSFGGSTGSVCSTPGWSSGVCRSRWFAWFVRHQPNRRRAQIAQKTSMHDPVTTCSPLIAA